MEFTLTTIIASPAKEIYSAWLSSEGHTRMTGGGAIASDKPGDSFSAWDGYITGSNLTLEPYKKIVQAWRTSEFSEGEEDSILEITLSETDGATVLTLKHTKIPGDGEGYKRGWVEHYFNPMKEYFRER